MYIYYSKSKCDTGAKTTLRCQKVGTITLTIFIRTVTHFNHITAILSIR